MKRINTEKFLAFLESQGEMAHQYENEAADNCKYEDAIRLREERLTYEYIYNICTGSDDTDIAEFMEEVEE